MLLLGVFLPLISADYHHPGWKKSPRSTKSEAWAPEEETTAKGLKKKLKTVLKKFSLPFLTLRRPNGQGVHVPVVPDLAQTLKVGSDYSENLTKVFDGAKNFLKVV